MTSASPWPRTGQAGRVLAKRRKELGLKQIDIQREFGLGPNYLSSVERGVRPINADGFLRLWDYYREHEKKLRARLAPLR